MIRRLAVIGVGLIGGSLARALRARHGAARATHEDVEADVKRLLVAIKRQTSK